MIDVASCVTRLRDEAANQQRLADEEPPLTVARVAYQARVRLLHELADEFEDMNGDD